MDSHPTCTQALKSLKSVKFYCFTSTDVLSLSVNFTLFLDESDFWHSYGWMHINTEHWVWHLPQMWDTKVTLFMNTPWDVLQLWVS